MPNFASSEEACLLSVVGNEIRFSKTLKQATPPKSPNHRAQVVLLAEEKNIEKVAECELTGGTLHIGAEVAAVLRGLKLIESRCSELLGRRSSDGVVNSSGTCKQ